MASALQLLSNLSSPVSILKGGTALQTRPRINIIEGSNVTIVATDDAVNYKTDITINSAGSGSGGTVTSVDGSGGTTGLTVTGGPITTTGTLTLGGTLGVANGGTGKTTFSTAGYVKANGTTALTSVSSIPGTDITGDISGTASNVTGIVAVVNGGTGSNSASTARTALGLAIGTDVLAPNGSAASLTSFPTLNQNTTGTASNVTGTVAIANGGTGQTTRQNALNALGGAVTSGYYLRGDGTNLSLSALSATDFATGTLAVAYGGTGTTSYTAGYVKASGTSAFTTVSTVPGSDVSGGIAGSSGSCTGNAATSSSCTGNSATATALATARAINGTNFDGTAAISISATATGTGAVARTINNRASDVFNVKDYGAVGNGSTADDAAIAAADTAAVAAGGSIVFPAGTYNVTGGVTIASPATFLGSKLLASSCTITVNGSISAGLFQIFSWSGSGAYIMGTKVGRCPTQWFGALNDTSDSSAAIQKTIASCDTNSVTVVFSGRLYGGDIILSSATSPNKCSISTDGNAELKCYSGKTNGITIRQIQYSPIHLPKLSDFTSGAAIVLESANVNTLRCETISACASGIKFNLTPSYTAILDNVINVTQIDNCSVAAIDIYCSVSGGTTQGNEIYANFSVANKRHCYWHDDGSATGINWDSNKFITQAIDANAISTAYGYHNSSSSYVAACILACETWLGGFNTGTPHFVDGRFDGCEFKFRWNDTPAYSGFTPTPQTGAGAAGNRYISVAGSIQYGTGLDSVATNSRASFNSGNVISGVPNKFLLKCTTGGTTAAGGIQNFYCYHPYVDGKCVVYATPSNGMSGFIVNAVADNNVTYANEIWIQLLNASGSSVAGGTVIYLWITVSST